MHRPASPLRDRCHEHTSGRSDPVKACPVLYSNQAVCTQAVAASDEVSMPQASSYQATPFQADHYHQLQIQTAAADRYAAKNDSFRMLSNAMAGRHIDKPYPPGRLPPHTGSIQACSWPSNQQKPVTEKQRANTVWLAASKAVFQGHPNPSAAEVHPSLNHPVQGNMAFSVISSGRHASLIASLLPSLAWHSYR